MSQHPSLKFSNVGVKHRNVLKRYERIKKLQEMEIWKDSSSVFKLPKVKSLKIKVKKTKTPKAEAAAGEGQPVVAPPAAKSGAAPAKTAAKGK